MIKHLDLFTGIGGFTLAAQFSGIKTVAQCEIDSECRKVLNKHWPKLPKHKDIRELNGEDYTGIDLITGGYPCQPFSIAGKQKAHEDDRHLWPEMIMTNGGRKNRTKVGTMKDAAVYGLKWTGTASRQGEGELSPRHLEWMMNYPDGWTETEC